MNDRRLQDLIRFYSILNDLEKTIGGARTLADCRGRLKWPTRGVYFFREHHVQCERARRRWVQAPAPGRPVRGFPHAAR